MQDDDTREQVGQPTSKIGKFDTAAELLAAYNALEREFTKRCQLIKQLQAAHGVSVAQAEIGTSENTSEPCDGDAQVEAESVVPRSCGDRSDDEKSQSDFAVQAESANATVAEERSPMPAVISITADAVLNEIAEHACEYAEALCAVPEIMDACIASYKRRLMGMCAVPSPSGTAVITPAKRPKSLADAKRLADALLL